MGISPGYSALCAIDVRRLAWFFVWPQHKSRSAVICEAVTRPSMRFVPVKSEDQQATLMLHSARELLISQRTALINALRGHFIVAPQGACNVRQLIATLEEDRGSPGSIDRDRGADCQTRQGDPRHSSQGRCQCPACHYSWYWSDHRVLPLGKRFESGTV